MKSSPIRAPDCSVIDAFRAQVFAASRRMSDKARARAPCCSGLPTSMAEASVGMLGRGRHSPVAQEIGHRAIGVVRQNDAPDRETRRARAHTAAKALPRLPAGMM